MGSGESKSRDDLISPAANRGLIPAGPQTIIAINRAADLKDEDFKAIVDATNMALTNRFEDGTTDTTREDQFCEHWNFPVVTVVIGTCRTARCFGTITIVQPACFSSKTASLGYHTQDSNGRPISVVDYTAHKVDNLNILGYSSSFNFTGVDRNSDSSTKVNSPHAYLSSTFSHEVFEMLIDPDLNNSLNASGEQIKFRSSVDHKVYPIAREVCDPVTSVDITVTIKVGEKDVTVSISNYVLPSWFYIDGEYPYDFGKNLSKPLTVYTKGTDYVSTTQSKVVFNNLKGWIPSTDSSLMAH